MKKSPRPSSRNSDFSRKRFGDFGEHLAAKWYVAEGYEILAQQWHGSGGEIDVIARRGRTLVFCEVKIRRNDNFADPIEAVTPAKQKKIRATAYEFIRNELGEYAPSIRYDIASIVGTRIKLYEDAF